jgi:hypothetical protein
MKKITVKYEAGESRTRTTKAEDGRTVALAVDYVLATVTGGEDDELELYAEAEPVEDDETGTYDDLKAEIVRQAEESKIDPDDKSELYRLLDEGLEAEKNGRLRPAREAIADIRIGNLEYREYPGSKYRKLVVDEVIYPPMCAGSATFIATIGTGHILFDVRRACAENMREFHGHVGKEWTRAKHNWEFAMCGCVPRDGYKKQSFGRAITPVEWDELVKELSLGEDDISGEFVETYGIWPEGKGEEITCRQIHVKGKGSAAIALEQRLKDVGIFAASTSPHRVNIRTK